jgi:hypothetical protein
MPKSPSRWVMLVFVACVLSFTIIAPLVRAQTPVDPQSLVGEWTGEWVWRARQTDHGPMSMTISKVEGNTVFASGEYRGGTRGMQSWTGKGTLDGNTLRIGKSTYTVDGNTMTGGNDTSNLTLTKKK